MQYEAYHFSFEDMEIGTIIPPKTYNALSGRKALMEECLESVRVENFSMYNSRLYCVFLAPSEESAKEWCRAINIDHWRAEHKEVVFFVYLVEIQEQPIWFDNDILIEFTLPRANKDAISIGYWNSGVTYVEPHTVRLLEYMTAKDVVIVDKTKWVLKPDGSIGKEK